MASVVKITETRRSIENHERPQKRRSDIAQDRKRSKFSGLFQASRRRTASEIGRPHFLP
jgi:hypothetical protein